MSLVSHTLRAVAIIAVLSQVVTAAPLTQVETNGLSKWGTLDAQVLPPFLTDRNTPLPHGYPWGKRTVEGTLSYVDYPNTGVIRPYDFTLKRGKIAPDGVERSVILVNGQYPGPLIEANWGDTIQVTVHNQISGPEEGTSLHWHGFRQTKTPWFDGVPSVTQCPIAPGKSFTYSFQASSYGTSWWHAHMSAQFVGGVAGPLVVHGPTHVKYDIDLGPIMVNDYFHTEYTNLVKSVMTVPVKFPLSQNNLIQGKGSYDCSKVARGTKCTPNTPLAKFRFQRGKIYRLRIINSSANSIQKFTIDGHKFKVFAYDFVPIKPYETKVLTIGIGQRVDVVVEANGKEDAYYMRSDLSARTNLHEQPHGLAVIYYNNADTHKLPKTRPTPYDDSYEGNDDLKKTEPVYPIAVPNPDKTLTFEVRLDVNGSGNTLWYTNNHTFRAAYDSPQLLLAKLGDQSYKSHPEWAVYNTGRSSHIRLIVKSYLNASHPWHLHGHDFFVLAEGYGDWDGKIVRPENPMRRDTQLQLYGYPDKPGYMVLQFHADNPGVWPFHCHIAWHQSIGLYTNIMTRPEEIMKREIPGVMAQTCREWARFRNRHPVEQIDSGL